MIPRWVIVVGAIIAIVWVVSDPAGAAHSITNFGSSIKTFAQNLG